MNWAILGIKLLKAFNATSIVMDTIFVLMKTSIKIVFRAFQCLVTSEK